MRDRRDERDAVVVGFGYLVYLVCLVGWTGKPTKWTKKQNEPDERERRTMAGKAKIGYLATG